MYLMLSPLVGVVNVSNITYGPICLSTHLLSLVTYAWTHMSSSSLSFLPPQSFSLSRTVTRLHKRSPTPSLLTQLPLAFSLPCRTPHQPHRLWPALHAAARLRPVCLASAATVGTGDNAAQARTPRDASYGTMAAHAHGEPLLDPILRHQSLPMARRRSSAAM